MAGQTALTSEPPIHAVAKPKSSVVVVGQTNEEVQVKEKR